MRCAYGATTRQPVKRATLVIPVYGVAVLATVLAITLPVVFSHLWFPKPSSLRLEPAVLAQAGPSPTVREEPQLFGRPGWIIESDKVRVGLLRGGGHIAEIRLISQNARLAINPMFVPAGNGYMGHMVCFPNFGPPSPEERQNGIGGHGEANAVDWQQTRLPQVDGQGITFYYGADLPKTQYRIERACSICPAQKR